MRAVQLRSAWLGAPDFFLHYFSLLMVWEESQNEGSDSRYVSLYTVCVCVCILHVQCMGGQKKTLSLIASAA